MSTRLRMLLGGAALLLTASIGLAAPASAETTTTAGTEQSVTATGNSTMASCIPDFRENGTRLRAAPNLGSAVVGLGYRGDCVRYNSTIHNGQNHQCATSGKWTSTWYNLTNLRTGVTGWVSACVWP